MDDKKCVLNFHQMGLDDRILKAVAKLGWIEPTLIQEKAIPLVLEGKDLLARGRTGSGKTAIFSIPIIQKILQTKQHATEQVVRALVLAPSKELVRQIHQTFVQLTKSCSRDVRCVDIASTGDLAAQKPLLATHPDIVVSTPARALAHLKANNLNLQTSLEFLVIDEADLVFSFGFENDVKEVLQYIPNVYQAILASATLNAEVEALKRLVLHQPVVLRLEEPVLPPHTQLTQYHIYAEEEDKAVLIYALLKLHLVRGKTLIFVNTVDRCYKVKLYLQQFGISTCALNSELPVSSRCHIVAQFNAGLYDVIIASDERSVDDPTHAKEDKEASKRKKDKESGVARGIDFQFVSNVVNFDFPTTTDSYIHRVGRTARGNNKGTALSFVSVSEKPLMEAVQEELQDLTPEGQESVMKPYQFRMEEVEAFRYRSRDAWRAVTRIAVREARLAEIKAEILRSQQLKAHFEDNPADMAVLRHDKALHTVRAQPHLKDVPDYIVPPTLKKLANLAPKSYSQQRQHTQGKSAASRRFEKRKADPLLSLEFDGFSKKKK